MKAFFAAFRHRPAMASFAIKTNINGAKIFWISDAETTGEGVVRGEYAAYESDNRKAMFFIVA
jgi:hypothetical protein